jgi:hypothetical protein
MQQSSTPVLSYGEACRIPGSPHTILPMTIWNNVSDLFSRLRPGENPRTYFWHIPKTAGMSTWQLLEWAYPESQICTGRMWEDIIHIPKQELRQYRAFRGHFLSYLEPYLDRPLRKFTILRDPVERTVSHYLHARRSPEHPYHHAAATMTLAEFCRSPRTRHMVENYQAGYLYWPAAESPDVVAKVMSREDLDHYKLQLHLDPDPARFPDTGALYRAAVERLDSFAAVGITEELGKSLRVISGALGFGVPPDFDKRNVGRETQSALDADTVRLIQARVQVDLELYDRARRKLAALTAPGDGLR